MSTLTILRGLSGSGKSTWAEAQHGAVVVSRDALRVAQFGSDGPDYYKHPDLRRREDLITEIEYAAILGALSRGMNAIADNTHIEWRYVKTIAENAMAIGAKVEIKTFDVTLRVAQERNALRAKMGGRNVPGEAIAKQHKRFQGTKNKTVADLPKPFIPVPYKDADGAPVVLVDVDGTLAHMGDRRRAFDWKKVGLDEPDHAVINLVNNLAETHVIVIMSGRDGSCREETLAWLNQHGVKYDLLYMRAEKDMRKDNIIKDELFEEHIAGRYDVQFVIDDRWQVCKMWLQKGLKVLNVSGLDRGEF